MKYASVCSGVEAASLAWMPLGWKAAWFSEIEPFPCAVLKERFPSVPNLGDMTEIKVENLENGDQKFTSGDGTVVLVPGGVDLLVGGTPCQSFSVAGKREGLEGASGLAKTFVELLGSMRPRWFVWENVPGCLSSRNKQTGIYDFNFLLAAFAEVGYTCGWRILDAQYVRVDGYPRAIPQRRRRVFVIGHLGAEWQYPAEVLFEPSCLCRNTPPKRVKGQGTAADAQRCLGTASTLTYKDAATFWNGNQYAESLTCTSDRQLMPDKARLQCVVENASAFNGAGMESGEVTPTSQANLGKLLSNQTPIVPNDQGGSVMQVENDGNAGTLRANTHGAETPIFNTQEYANPVTANHGGLENCVTSQCGAFLGQMGSKAGSIGYDTEVSPTVNVGQLIDCVCYENHANDSRVKNMGGVMGVAQGVDVYNHTETGDIATTITANSGEPNTAGPKVMTGATVRRLLPVECERLMGFPDNHTRIPWKGKQAEDCPDSPRYKACGNSMCVNVMRWLGLRIELVELFRSDLKNGN